MYHSLLSFPIRKVPHPSCELYESTSSISCPSFAAPSPSARVRQVRQATKPYLSQAPTGHSLAAVTRVRTSCGRQLFFNRSSVSGLLCMLWSQNPVWFWLLTCSKFPASAYSRLQRFLWLLPLIFRRHLSSGSRLHLLFQVHAGWFLPHPTLCFWALCCVIQPPVVFLLLASGSVWQGTLVPTT